MPINRLSPKIFVAAIQKIEKRCARRDRHFDVAYGKAAAALAETSNSSAHGIEAENGSARKDQGIDPLDGHLGFEQARVSQTRRAAMNRYRGDGGRIKNQHSDAGAEFFVMRVADAKAGDSGDEIFQSCRLPRFSG